VGFDRVMVGDSDVVTDTVGTFDGGTVGKLVELGVMH